MRAGEMNRRIRIQQPTTGQDAYGQPLTESWTDVLGCWAGIRAATGREVYAASGFTSQVSHKITIRFPSVTLSGGMRVLYGQRTFLIQAVSNPDESPRELDLLCLELNGRL